MCFEILVRDAIPSQWWPQKPPRLGTSERWGRRGGLGCQTRLCLCHSGLGHRGGQSPGCSPAQWQGGKIFHARPRRGTGMGADPAASPDHLPSGWRAQEGPKSPAAAKGKQEGSGWIWGTTTADRGRGCPRHAGPQRRNREPQGGHEARVARCCQHGPAPWQPPEPCGSPAPAAARPLLGPVGPGGRGELGQGSQAPRQEQRPGLARAAALNPKKDRSRLRL